ncbi:TPA: hypothetical protein ACHU8M_001602, partial [Streptococcus suis]
SKNCLDRQKTISYLKIPYLRRQVLKQVSLFNILPETSRIDDNITEFSASYSLDLLTIISKIPRNSRIFFWK